MAKLLYYTLMLAPDAYPEVLDTARKIVREGIEHEAWTKGLRIVGEIAISEEVESRLMSEEGEPEEYADFCVLRAEATAEQTVS